MKKISLLAALAIAVAGVSPVVAQPVAGWNADVFWRGAPTGIRERIEWLQHRIDRGIANGSLNRWEGRRAQRDLNDIRRSTRRMRWDNGHLSRADRDVIQDRLDNLSRRLHWLRHNGN